MINELSTRGCPVMISAHQSAWLSLPSPVVPVPTRPRPALETPRGGILRKSDLPVPSSLGNPLVPTPVRAEERVVSVWGEGGRGVGGGGGRVCAWGVCIETYFVDTVLLL